ncbi:MAG: NAD-dependent epimerase/dehydratase family protein [Pyrinomonadaceae bacterium]|nr:NAD-dependent epimerase/dehydratase family protein [Pyrinomonadaceae bacterium]
MKKQILVTGGAGFIGSHLVSALLKEDKWDVAVVDNFDGFYDPEIKRCNIRDLSGSENFELFEVDICDRNSMDEVFSSRDFDAVIHLAARAGVRPSLEKPHEYAKTNVGGTLSILEMMREYDVPKLVFGSSSSVYGARCKVPFKESEDVTKPISPYAATKLAGEALCHTYSHLYRLNAVCLRFFTVYGACQRPDLAIHKFSRLISRGAAIPMYGDGTTRRDYTYVEDIIQGIRAAVDYDDKPFDVFNLGESRTVELKELIRLLEEKLGKKAVIDRMAPQAGDVPLTCADISKARELLGYSPKTRIEEGLDHFVEWFNKRQTIDSKAIV